MRLHEGQNTALLAVDDFDLTIPFSIYLLKQESQLVITDIDGTITTSDIKGFIGGNLGSNVHHANVENFFNRVSNNGYILVYLSARPVAFDDLTRDYLFDNLHMPEAPILLSPIAAEAALTADPDVMKTVMLHSLLEMFDKKQDVVVGAYGNKNTDTEAYSNVGIRGDRIFLINSKSEIRNVLTGNKSSYHSQSRNVTALYPKING